MHVRRANSAAGRPRTRPRPGTRASGALAPPRALVPAELGGSDAPREMLDDDPELESEVLGRTTGSDEPATESGVDLEAGDDADATSDGRAEIPDDAEPDLKDIGTASTGEEA